MERSGGQDSGSIDKDRVLNVKPLRCLAPVFPSAANFSSFSPPQGVSPHVYAPPSGPFPPGVTAFYPFYDPSNLGKQPEQNSQTSNRGGPFSTPIADAVPLNSYRTPTTASGSTNGDAGPSRRGSRRRGQIADEDGHDDGLDMSVLDPETDDRAGRRKTRSRLRGRNSNSHGVDTDRILNDILTSFDLTTINDVRRMDGDRETIELVLTIFDLLRRKLTQIDDTKEGLPRSAKRPDLRVGALLMSKGVRTNVKKRVGAVPGVEIGDIFYFRMELCIVGLHAPSMAGIDYLGVKSSQEEEPLAVSIVSAGGYEDNVDDGDVLIYSGQGGNMNIYNKTKEATDQKLERGNLALEKSLHRGNEVRVIRGVKDPFNATGKIYVYDGLYKIQDSWMDKGKSGNTVFKYKFIRLPGQPPVFSVWQSIQMRKDGLALRTGSILPDLTSGAESVQVALVNDVDGEKGPEHFTYLLDLKYSNTVDLKEPTVSCNCVGGCQPGNQNCECIQKNEGYLPYNANGILVSRKSMLYECGPSCQCPPNCRNRVSQGGLKFRLEVFKTNDKGWGLRSWDPIRAGAYICEYAGEVIDISKVEDGTLNNNDYIFDATRTYQPLELLPSQYNEDPKIPFSLVISAKNTGNVARFMNHSCSPNVFWQPVLRGNRSYCDLHVVFHAIKNIPPMTELTYDYGIVQSGIAEQWKKKCLCGSAKCRGYFY